MGIRQTVNDKPVAAAIVIAVIVLGTLIGVYMTFYHHPRVATHTKCYYCDEDGKNVFIDDAENVPPFDHNGKRAYRAVIFKCVDGQGRVIEAPFVQRVECYDEQSRAAILKEIDNGTPVLAAEYQFDPPPTEFSSPGGNPAPPPPKLDGAAQALVQREVKHAGLMIKRPADPKWVNSTDGKAWTDIIGERQCPGGILRPVSIAEKALGAQ